MQKHNAQRTDNHFIPPQAKTTADFLDSNGKDIREGIPYLKKDESADELDIPEHLRNLPAESGFIGMLTNYPDDGLNKAVKAKRKICILGTAPQWTQAPFGKDGWEFWGIFGVVGIGHPLNRIYELHTKEEIEPLAEKHASGKYWEIAKGMGKNYITRDAYDQAPEATRFDFNAKLEKYGPYFASSAAWMLADAIDQEPDEIAIYGINMAHDTEYSYQKPSMVYLIGFARARGIKVTLPDTSELLQVPYQYGLQKEPQVLAILAQKKAEYSAQLAAHRNNQKVSEMGVYGMEQCMQLLTWFEQNFK